MNRPKIPVLKIRDENGNLIPINAIRGENGKSAYEQAKDGGYRGTEGEFINFLNGTIGSDNSSHTNDFGNPHNVTAEQTGALPTLYPTSADLNTELTMGGNRTAIHCYYGETLNTPYKERITDCTHGMVITNAHSSEYATQLCLPSGENRAYIRTLNGQGVQPWKQVAVFDDVAESEAYLQQYIDGQIAHLEQTAEDHSNKIDQEILPALEEKASVETDFYTGAGVTGNTNPTIIDIKANTKAVIVYCATQNAMMSPLVCLKGQSESVYYHPTTKETILNMVWTNNQLKIWHASSAEAQFNASNKLYGYMLING